RLRGGCSGQVRTASSSASWRASSAVAKSSPRRTSVARAPGTRKRSSSSSQAWPLWPAGCCPITASVLGAVGHHLPHVYPLVQRRAAGPGLGGNIGGDLHGPFVGVHVHQEPARHQVTGLGVRALGGDRGGVGAAVAHPRLGGGEGADIHELTAFLQQLD